MSFLSFCLARHIDTHNFTVNSLRFCSYKQNICNFTRVNYDSKPCKTHISNHFLFKIIFILYKLCTYINSINLDRNIYTFILYITCIKTKVRLINLFWLFWLKVSVLYLLLHCLANNQM